MRTLLRFALLVGLALGGCAGEIDRGSQNDPGSNGSGGPPASGGGGSMGGNTKPPPSGYPTADAGASIGYCAQLIPISAPSFQDLPAGPGRKLRVRVQASDPTAPPATWTWNVAHGDGAGTDVPVVALDPQATEVEFPLEQPGRYTLEVGASVRSIPCTVTALAFAVASDQRLGQFRVRVTPPEGQFPVQELRVQAMAGKPLAMGLLLEQGQPVTFQPRDDRGGIASYVRVSQLGSSLAVEGHTGHADFKPALLGAASYDVLFVPDEEVAPYVVLGQTPAMLNVLSQKLSPGAALTGKLLDGAGAPMKDGRVILRAGALTSTVGASSATGDFALRVRPGQFAVTVSPPPASGLPELTLAPESGLTIGEVPAAGAVEVKWAAVTPAPVGLMVTTAAGLPAAGARLRLERVAPLPAAGTLIYTAPGASPISHMVPGYVRLNGVVTTDGSGNLPGVPPGAYRLLITPSDADRLSALTTVTLDIPAGGLANRMVRLVNKVKLRGTLLPAESTGTKIFATPQELDPPRPVASATVGPGGAYQLDVDPERLYVVWADPGVGKPRVQLARVRAAADGAQVPDRTLPKALAFTGTLVSAPNGYPVPNAVIQVLCEMAASSCLDPGVVLSEGVSDRAGKFTLSVPDPGTL
jgi:hypothetical protein